jgi:hypothetical protein
LKWSHPIFAFLWLSLLGKEPGPSFEQSFILFKFVPDLIEIGLWRRFFSINTDVNMVFLIVAPPDPQGPWSEQTWIYIILKNFDVNMSSSGFVVLEKIFKWPHPIFAFL